MRLNYFNSLIAQFQESISCDSACLLKKEKEQLEKQLQEAEVNMISAPQQIVNAQKKLVTFVSGEDGYDAFNEQQLNEKADEKIRGYKEKYDEMAKKITTQINTYEGIFINFENVKDLYLKYKKENDMLMKQVKNTTNDVLTSERKTFYQDQQVDVLKFYYYYIILIIYCICVFCFLIFSFIYPSKTDWKIRLVSFIILILLPFISTWILGLCIYIVYFIYDLIPKNVYKGEIDAKINYNYFKNLKFL
jgi:hypothetical protein